MISQRLRVVSSSSRAASGAGSRAKAAPTFKMMSHSALPSGARVDVHIECLRLRHTPLPAASSRGRRGGWRRPPRRRSLQQLHHPAVPRRPGDAQRRMEYHLASLRFVNTTIALDGPDQPAFPALKGEFADVLAGPSPGLPPDAGSRHVQASSRQAPGPRTRSIKRLSAGELAKIRR